MGKGMEWRNRIVGYGEEAPESFLANPKNWRIHSLEQQEGMEAVLEEVGIVQNVVVNKATGFLVDGHLRVVLALRTHQKSLPVTYVDITPEEEDKILATFDILTGYAGKDREKLAELMKGLETENENLEKLFDNVKKDNRLDEFFNNGEVEEDEARIDEAEELLKVWSVVEGQIWEIPSITNPNGVHRVICGDAVDPNIFERLMGDEKARMVWTDPPYGVKYGDNLKDDNPQGYRVRKIKNDDLTPEELEVLIRNAMANCGKHTMPGATFYMASPSSGNLLPTLLKSIDNTGFTFHWLLVWVKDQLVLGRSDYHFRHENILYGWKTGGSHYFTSDRTQNSVFEYPRPKSSAEHPTMKPVGLVAHQIKNSSHAMEMVIDPFGGSGTTMVAAERTNRLGRLVEIEPKYVAVILQRMADLGMKPEKKY